MSRDINGARLVRLADLPQDHPLPLIGRRRVIGSQVMVSEVTLDAGFIVATHSHPNEQMSLILKGRLRFGVGPEGSPGRRMVEVGAGEMLHLPPDVPHSAQAMEDSIVLDIFSPPSEKTGIDRR